MASIVVEAQPEVKDDFMTPENLLISWILKRIQPWEDYRESNFREDWDEYYRLWRGKWTAADKQRDSERSKLISPALSQAIEVATAEITEAIFGKGQWFDVVDDYFDQNPEDAFYARKLLREDFEEANIQAGIEEAVLLGAIYGTGIGKIVLEKVRDKSINKNQISENFSVPTVVNKDRVLIKLLAVEPNEFVIDPYTTDVNSGLGCAHITYISKSDIIQKQHSGEYRTGMLGAASEMRDVTGKMEVQSVGMEDFAKVVEYHGLVPRTLLENAMNVPSEEEDGQEEVQYVVIDNYDDLEDDDLVEAIVTFANDETLLKVTENQLLMKDRGFIAFQFDTVPNRFWGRGIAEKGYNSQKALDAELRGRIDAMALTIHPMMGVDSTRLIKGSNLQVKPGKSILTLGSPKDILMPLTFGVVNGNTFSQAGELERMIQMATGAMDSAAPIGVSPRNSTASGMSMLLSGAIKRSKRTLENIENNFIVPLLNKALWRYMQFDSKRYPIADMKFRMKGSLGIMARELEQNQLANMLKTVTPDSPAYWMLILNMYELSSLENKEEMIQITKEQLQKALNPQPNPVQQAEVQKLQAEVENLKTDAMLNIAKARSEAQKSGEGEVIKAKLDAELKMRIALMDNQTKRDIAEMEARNELQVALLKAEADAQLKAKELEDKKELKKKEISLKRENGKLSGVEVTG